MFHMHRIQQSNIHAAVYLCLVVDGCTPPDGHFYQPMQDFYKIGDTVTYVCSTGEDVVSTCQANHTWTGERCHQCRSYLRTYLIISVWPNYHILEAD